MPDGLDTLRTLSATVRGEGAFRRRLRSAALRALIPILLRRSVSREPAMAPKNPDVILTELPDGTGVLLHLGTKFYYALNRTGVAAWKMLEHGEARSVADVARLLAERFSGAREEDARRDVEALLAELRAERLLPPGVGE